MRVVFHDKFVLESFTYYGVRKFNLNRFIHITYTPRKFFDKAQR